MTHESIIAIVDDNDSMRRLTERHLKRDGWTVEGYSSGDDFLAEPRPHRFACVLLDVRMPGTDGIDVLRALADRGDMPPILVVTGHGDVEKAVLAMKLGAADFLEKPFEAKEMLAALRAAIAADADARSVSGETEAAAAVVAALTARQQQILAGIVRGQANKIIAWELGLSVRTVEAYRAQLFDRLGVTSTAGAVRLAMAARFEAPAPLPNESANRPA